MPEARTLPDDVESLKRLVREQQSALVTARAELLEVQLVVEKLRFELARTGPVSFAVNFLRHRPPALRPEYLLEPIA